VRYVHLTETEAIDWQQLAAWAVQASRLPGERVFWQFAGLRERGGAGGRVLCP